MGIISKRTQLWVVLLGLLGLQFAVMALFVEHDVFRLILPYAETPEKQLGLLAGLAVGGVGVARYGYGRPNRIIQLFGAAVMVAAYGLLIPYLVRRGLLAHPFIAIELSGVTTVLASTLLYWYATISRRQFRTWDARAVTVFLSAVLLAIAGWFVRPVLAGAAIVAVFPLVMHFFHVIGFVQDGAIQPIRHGTRLYVSIFGFYVELTLYFIRAVKRLW